MRELIERGGFVSPVHRAAVMRAHHDLTNQTLPGRPASPVDGDQEVGRCVVHAGGREASQRAPQEPGEAMAKKAQAIIVADRSDIDAIMLAARVAHDAVWDRARAMAAEERPMPL